MLCLLTIAQNGCNSRERLDTWVIEVATSALMYIQYVQHLTAEQGIHVQAELCTCAAVVCVFSSLFCTLTILSWVVSRVTPSCAM